jgi:DNA repair exonuclease SbcCD ATPase subunit
MLEKVPLSHVVEAQRIVIRALSARHNSQKISYAPEREIDRKIWYLELLE